MPAGFLKAGAGVAVSIGRDGPRLIAAPVLKQT
ncbi:MAG: hypothetical protein ACI96W_002685 [Paraglaciecola sp.]|jgi:hypothetical protein